MMKQKLFVLNGSPQQMQELKERLGDHYDISACHSIGEIERKMGTCGHGTTLSAPTIVNGNTAGGENRDDASVDIESLLSRIMEGSGEEATPRTLAARVDLLEQKIIESTLDRNRHHRKDTAAELGISRVTLYNKMKKFGMLN
jgi:DNA-binding NtrC family response regulator